MQTVIAWWSFEFKEILHIIEQPGQNRTFPFGVNLSSDPVKGYDRNSPLRKNFSLNLITLSILTLYQLVDKREALIHNYSLAPTTRDVEGKVNINLQNQEFQIEYKKNWILETETYRTFFRILIKKLVAS